MIAKGVGNAASRSRWKLRDRLVVVLAGWCQARHPWS